MKRTEFYEVAVKAGFYGLEAGGLSGKKDNVRKYWEDTFIKTAIRSIIQELVPQRQHLRIIDLGAGSGEGYELLTHIPPSHPVKAAEPFVLMPNQIQTYDAVDISPAMVAQGRANYQGRPGLRFMEADLARGFPCGREASYDIYFSSYCALSHLTAAALEDLSAQIFSHARKGSVMVFDVHGRFSPEWPDYWGKGNAQQLPYTMAYLLPTGQQDPDKIAWFPITYWSAEDLRRAIERAGAKAGRRVSIQQLKDRSVLVGRHMETTLFKPQRFQLRIQINRLFDRDYRGEITGLRTDLAYLENHRQAHAPELERILTYNQQWSTVIDILEALMSNAKSRVKQILEASEGSLAEDLAMLAWLYRNADRFPVLDFWASVMGPQVACVLRNLEFNLPDGLGCGHSLLSIVQVED